MARGRSKPPELRPWDRRPWPPSGDANQETLYAAVGRALSEWERYDAVLSFLFSAFATPADPAIGRRAFSAVRTLEGRIEMLRAASEAYFSAYPNEQFLTAWKEILSSATQFSARRNDIAHGAVDYYQPEPPTPREIPAPERYALFPSFATFRERDMDNAPRYCYTSIQLEYFRQQFFLLRLPAAELSSALMRAARKRASFGKLRSLYRQSTNRDTDRNDQPESERPPEPSPE